MSGTDTPAANPLDLDAELLALLVCPLSKAPLIRKGDKLYCIESRKVYRIEDGIPIMLVDEATDMTDAELLDLKQA